MSGASADWRDRVQRSPRRAPRSFDGDTDTDAPRGEPTPHEHHAECYACPVGAAFASAAEAQPDARAHLLNAIHELIGVARAVLDAADSVVDQQRRTGPTDDRRAADDSAAARPSRVRRIDIG
ncbi:MAG TPA: hypothetical protein VFZ83_05730 [Acidimicrobiia bacterium]|nr:hypothetical protein [Acidimicrobiia bacterium]